MQAEIKYSHLQPRKPITILYFVHRIYQQAQPTPSIPAAVLQGLPRTISIQTEPTVADQEADQEADQVVVMAVWAAK